MDNLLVAMAIMFFVPVLVVFGIVAYYQIKRQYGNGRYISD